MTGAIKNWVKHATTFSVANKSTNLSTLIRNASKLLQFWPEHFIRTSNLSRTILFRGLEKTITQLQLNSQEVRVSLSQSATQ